MLGVTAVLFDLDGTLLPMDQEAFARRYFSLLAGALAPYGYGEQELIRSIWQGTSAMVRNDGSRRNEEVFWEVLCEIWGEKIRGALPIFDAFYRGAFEQVRQTCGRNPLAVQTVYRVRELGYRIALATNPIFPAAATERRIRWAGLKPEDFECITTYENSRHCKPNLAYYLDVAERMGVSPSDCIMVGNDAQEDLAAEQSGMRVFLLTDCLINPNRKDISAYPNGDFTALARWMQIV